MEWKMADPILILHLSDLHFGPNSRFCDSDPQRLSQKFYKALEKERIKREISIKIALVIVTGDITERARSEEYKTAEDFFRALAQHLSLDHKRFIFIPGNHDVSWLACKHIELDQEESSFSDEELRRRMDSEKFRKYKEFLENFYGFQQNPKSFDLNCDGCMYDIDDLRLSIAGINTNELESHRKEDHRGFISKNQAQSLMDRWYGDKLNFWIRIIAIHHNPSPTVPENIKDGIKYLEKLGKEGKLKTEDIQRFSSDAVGFEGYENLVRIAEDCQVQLVLHGHHHVAGQRTWPWHGEKAGITNVLSAGSWGLIPDQLPKDQPNSLQMILLNPERNELDSWILVYDPRVRTEGAVELGNFTPDPANLDGFHQRISFLNESQLYDIKQQKEMIKKPDDIIEFKQEARASPKIYYPKPYLLQKHFTGRAEYRRDLTEWLTKGNNPIFVLTGLSGSGKSALTWIWFQHDVLGVHIDDLLIDPPEIAKSYHVPENARPEGVIWWSFYDREARFSVFLEKSVCKLSEWTNSYSITSSNREHLEKLIEILYNHYILIILDGFERELLDNAKDIAYPEEIRIEGNAKKDFRSCTDRYADEFLKRILSPNMRSRVLLTSQLFPKQLEGIDHFPVSYCVHKELQDLKPDEAVKFFRAQGVRGSPTQIETVCSTYGNHSLTLRLLSGLIFFHPEHPGDITAANEYDPVLNPETRTYYILSKIYEVMHPEISELLCKISAFRSTTNYKKIAILSFFKDEGRLKEAIKELTDRGLLQFNRELGLYDLHPIIRKYAYERLVDKEGVHSRLRDYFFRRSKQNNNIPDKLKSSEELIPIIELYYHTAKMGLFDEAYRLFDKRLMYSLYYRFGAYLTIIELLTILLPSSTNGNWGLEKERDRRDVFNALAIAYQRLGQLTLAEYYNNLAVELSDKLGNKKDRIINRSNLADVQIELGKFAEARKILQQRVEGKEDEFASSVLHRAKAHLFIYEGNFTDASQELNNSLRIINKLNTKSRMLQSLCVIYAEKSRLYLFRKMPAEALKFAEKSLTYCIKPKKEGESFERDFIVAEWLIGASYVSLSNCQSERKNEFLDHGEFHLSEAIVRCRNINLADLEPAILLTWAQCYYSNHDFKKSAIFAEDALNLAERCGQLLYQAEIHNFFAQLALNNGDYENAQKHAETAHKLALCGYNPALSKAKSILDKLDQIIKT